ncbi:MAG: hypothetical protein U0531_06250 [Dehalococcoidia bacterium]
MPGQWARLNVVATFPDLEAARDAITALERAGVDGNRISLLGRQAQEAKTDPDTSGRDARVSADVAKAGALGTAAGTVGGGLVGLLAGAAAFGIPGIGPVVGIGIWAATAGGAGVGAAIGGLVAGTAALNQSDSNELTYHEPLRAGHALVAVHADDEGTLAQAEQRLRDQGPLRLDHVDANGRRTDA